MYQLQVGVDGRQEPAELWYGLLLLMETVQVERERDFRLVVSVFRTVPGGLHPAQ